jgi:thiamine biosynthesis lipoprotein
MVMGIEVSLILSDSDEEHCTLAAETTYYEMQRLEDILSSWKPESETSRINRAEALTPIPVSDETLKVVERALELSRQSGGAFDITVGPLRRAWGLYTSPRVPSEEELTQVLSVIGYDKIKVDREKRSILLTKQGVELDLGGIAKGYILERGVEILKSRNIKAGLIDGSGDVCVWGRKPDGSLWKVGVRDPRNPEKLLTVLPVTNAAVFSSGDYERNFEEEGVLYHHIFNPKTGKPAAGCHGVTVIGDTIDHINGLSSTVFVLGPEKGMEFIEKSPGLEAVITTVDGKVLLSKGFEKRFPDAFGRVFRRP